MTAAPPQASEAAAAPDEASQLSLDEVSGTVWVRAAHRVASVEQCLRARGFTLGWGPLFSTALTVGDVLEQRTHSLLSARYGEPASCCVALEGTLTSGAAFRTTSTPRSAAGIDWKHLLLGHNGRYGTVNNAQLRVTRLPEHLEWLVYHFEPEALPQAVSTLARWMHHGVWPSLAVLEPSPTGVLLVARIEGSAGITVARATLARRLLGGGQALDAQVALDWCAAQIEPADGTDPLYGQLRNDGLKAPSAVVGALWAQLPGLCQQLSDARLPWLLTHCRHEGARVLLPGKLPGGRRSPVLRALAAAGGVVEGRAPAGTLRQLVGHLKPSAGASK